MRYMTIMAAACLTATADARQAEHAGPFLAAARTHQRRTIDALGEVKFGPLAVETLVTPADPRILGVAYGWGHFWVSGRAAATTTGHKIYKFNPEGHLVGAFAQASQSAFWGGRDGAANEATNRLYFGEDNSRLVEYAYSPATGGIAFSRSIDLAAIVSPFGGAPSVVRGIAVNPSNGHFFTVFHAFPTTNPVIGLREFTIDPPVLVREFVNFLPLYGVGYSPTTDTLWVWHQGNGGCAGVVAAELSLPFGDPTGRTFTGVTIPAGCTWPNVAGGCEVYCGDPHNPGRVSMVAIHQATPDSLVVYDLDGSCADGACYADCNGDGALTIADFACFQSWFATASAAADCDADGNLNVSDFGCFQTRFAAGCP